MEDNFSQGMLYKSIVEQINDYLALLDLKILMTLVIQQEERQEDGLNGFAISYEEILKFFSITGNNTRNTAEVTGLKREIEEKEIEIEKKNIYSKAKGFNSHLDTLCEVFRLSRAEKQIVLMCISTELNRKYEKVYGFLQDDLTIKRPTLDVALKILYPDMNERFEERIHWLDQSILKRYLLSDMTKYDEGISMELRLNSRITNYIFGIDRPEDEISNFVNIYDKSEELPSLLSDVKIQDNLKRYFGAFYSNDNKNQEIIFVDVKGGHGSGKTLQIRHLCQYINKNLLLVYMDNLLAETNPARLIKKILCERKLQNAVLAFKVNGINKNTAENSNEDKISQVLHLVKNILEDEKEKEALFILSDGTVNFQNSWDKAEIIDVSIKTPGEKERMLLWQAFGKKYEFCTKINWGEMASKFIFSPGQVKEALELASLNAVWGASEDEKISKVDLFRACYCNGRNHLIKKASRIEPKYEWEDVILPEESKSLLRQACNQMRYHQTVFGDWGFYEKLAYGKGLSMLFSGPPGTGKTMSAQIVARELGLELYKIDISQLVSKYVGETEKNISEIFYEAQLSNAILLFDEADALFGKRTEVRDSHDRYSNIEVAYLLQKIEEYEGISILTTNYLKNVDEAFLRRFNFIIEFPFPDEVYREKIWRNIFPQSAPVSKNVDFSLVAEKIEMSGGNIKNIALAAAFLAAEKNEQIEICHIINAAKNEMTKMGKIFITEDLEEYFS